MRLILAVLLALAPAAAAAHTGQTAEADFFAGITHPLFGTDHLLAMLAVGIWAALTGGRALWAYPAAFVAAMLAGGLTGAGAGALAGVEPAILASVVVIGAAAALALRVPMPVALAALALFGAAHGYAHGLEGPGGGAYTAGFALATLALHMVGIALGVAASLAGRTILARAAGGAVAIAGAALAFG